MELYFFISLMLPAVIRADLLTITPIAQVLIGGGKNEIAVYEDQGALYFTIDESEWFWLTDAEDNEIKAFNNKGKLLYIISSENPSARIEKIHAHSNYLLALNSEGFLFVYGKDEGKLLSKLKLNVERAKFDKAYFYDSFLFLPQRAFSTNENMYKLDIEVRTSPEQIVSVVVRQLDRIINAYDFERGYQIFPVDNVYNSSLKGIEHLDFKGQSEDYILIEKYREGKKEPDYYIFIKSDHRIKKVGSFKESITGLIANYWWGESSRIVGKYLYLMGVKYKEAKHHHGPQKIIISRVDLSNIDKLPTVAIEEVLAK